MKHKRTWKKGLSLLMVLCLVWTVFGQYLPIRAVKAAEAKKYTVEINNVTDLFLCNAKPSDGPVTLTYTVESATAASIGNNGVIATTAPKTTLPYNGTGSMQFHHAANVVLIEGDTYSITMQLDAAGKVSTDDVWLPNPAGDSTTDAKYFGIYVHPTTTAKLTDVTCTDAAGNDLGLQSNSLSCVITDPNSTTESPEAGTYTVELKNAGNVFLCNAKPTDGPVTITYEVEAESVSEDYAQGGVVATTSPTTAYPYDKGNGAIQFDNDCYLLYAGYKHTVVITKIANNMVDGTYMVEGMWNNQTYHFTHSAGTGNADVQYFGIWFASGNGTAKLKNVTCRDAAGNDLGLQSNSSSCVITDPNSTTESPEAGTYTVEIKDVTNLFLCNAIPSDGPVTLTYTVKSATLANAGNNGVIATTAPTATYPYNGTGSMKFHHVQNVVMIEGTTYSITMQLGTDGTVSTDDVSLPNPAGGSTADAKYFGIYVNPTTTATLTNVTCTDAAGNDLGLQSNNENCVITGLYSEMKEQSPVSYNLKDGSYLVTGNCTVTDANGDEVTVDADNPVLSQPGDYTLVTAVGIFPYRKVVSLYLLGDVDLNGTAGEAGDLAKLQELLAGKTDAYTAEKAAEYAADLDNDGKVGSKDLELMQSIRNGNTTLADVLKKYHVAALTFDYIGGDEVMPIVGYYGPYSRGGLDYLNDDIFKAVKDVGINLINYSFNGMGEGGSNVLASKALELAEKYGIGQFVEDFRLNPEHNTATNTEITANGTMTMKEVAELIGDYSQYESFLGHHVADEPFPNACTVGENRKLKYFDWTSKTLNSYANMLGFINLYAENGKGYFDDAKITYKDFCDAVIQDTKAKVLSFDDYPFGSEAYSIDVQGTYFKSLWNTRNKAQENGIPFWSYVMAGGDYYTGAHETVQERIPSAEETYWNVNTSLAFGVKGIEWFTLIQSPSLAEDNTQDSGYDYDRSGLIGVNGEKTTYYQYAQKMNKQIAAIDEVLMKAESTGIMATGTKTQSVLRGSGVTLLSGTEKLQSVTAGNTTYGALVGCFDYRDTEAFYVMNYDTAAAGSDTITLTFDKAHDVRLIQDGVTTFASGSTVTLTIPSGEAVLVVLEDRVVEVSDISSYRGETYSVPDAEPGYVFAGWYQDAACTNPIASTTTSGKAYAKFVDEIVLTVKSQISAGITASSATADIRFVTTADTLRYSTIGFEVTANGITNTYGSNKVYEQLYAVNSQEVMTEYKPYNEFSKVSTYFKACTISEIANKSFDAEWSVRAYWTTLDGTTVYGETAVRTVAAGIGL